MSPLGTWLFPQAGKGLFVGVSDAEIKPSQNGQLEQLKNYGFSKNRFQQVSSGNTVCTEVQR